MSWTWALEVFVSSVITWTTFLLLGWAWARRKLLPFLREHAPRMLAMYEESQQARKRS